MSPFTYFGLMVVGIVILVAVFNVPFVIDAVNNSGYGSAEVFSGVTALFILFITGVFIVSSAGRR